MNRNLCPLSTFIAIAVALALAGCGDRSVSGSVAATVNGQEIAVHQIGHPNRPAPGAADIEALDQLIDRELLVQKALELRIDQDPAVVQEIEAAKHQILAKTYIDRNMRSVRLDPEEIRNFYREHPALFEQRRIYRFNELIAAFGVNKLASFTTQVAGSRELGDVAAWLQARNLLFNTTASIKAAEEIPADLLPRIAAMKAGQIAVFETPGSVSIIQLLQAQEAPLGLAEAKPAIERILLGRKREALTKARAGQLRERAQIEYQGLFADAKNHTPPAPAAQKPPAVTDDAHFIKGLSSLL